MFGSEILDVAIGLIFLYVILSFIATAMREGLESLMKTRATDLYRGVKELLRDDKLVAKVYRHPLLSGLYANDFAAPKRVGGLFPSRSELPSYIPPGNFALALLDLAARPDIDGAAMDASAPVLTLGRVRESVGSIANEGVRRVLLTAVDRADGDFARAQANVEAWFNGSMDRVSGWYKRRTQIFLLIIGLFVAVVTNADSFAIARFLYENDAARVAVVAQAEVFRSEMERAGGPAAVADTALRRRVLAGLDDLGTTQLPIGWVDGRPNRRLANPPKWSENLWRAVVEYLLVPLPGWLATAFAVSLGAPFWFDLLNKVMVIRSTVKPHEKSPPEASEDRQRRNSPPPPHLGGVPDDALPAGAGQPTGGLPAGA